MNAHIQFRSSLLDVLMKDMCMSSLLHLMEFCRYMYICMLCIFNWKNCSRASTIKVMATTSALWAPPFYNFDNVMLFSRPIFLILKRGEGSVISFTCKLSIIWTSILKTGKCLRPEVYHDHRVQQQLEWEHM